MTWLFSVLSAARRFPPWAWGVLLALAIGVGLYQGHVHRVREIERAARADEQKRISEESEKRLAAVTRRAVELDIQRLQLLRALARQDTQLTQALARAERVARTPAPVLPASLVDTLQVRRSLLALQSNLTSCQDTLHNTATACAAYRRTADSALAVGASQHAADSVALVQHAVITAAITRSRDAAVASLQKRSTWRTVERTACAASVAGNLFNLFSR